MSGKCIIRIPQDNQSKTSNVLEQRTLPNILHELRAEPWRRITGWSEYRKQPRTLVTSPFMIRPHLICKSPGYNGLNPPTSLTGGRRVCIQTKGRRWLTQRHTLLCARYLYILKNLITFSLTSLELRHYYQSPWDHQNDSKQSLKIITFTLKPYSYESCQYHWLREWKREDADKRCSEIGCQMLICKQCHLSLEAIGQIFSL